MKQSLERNTRLLSIGQAQLFLLLLALFLLALPFSGCVRRSHNPRPSAGAGENASTASKTTDREVNEQQPDASSQAPKSNQQRTERININTASANELETLPGIGKSLATRIIDHREKYGLFRRPEHLIIVRGISDRRFRTLRDLITVE